MLAGERKRGREGEEKGGEEKGGEEKGGDHAKQKWNSIRTGHRTHERRLSL